LLLSRRSRLRTISGRQDDREGTKATAQVQDAPPQDLAELWTGVREDLQASLPDSTYALWLEPLRAAAVRGGVLYLTAPDGIRDWVGRRYAHLLRDAVAERTGGIRDVAIVTGAPPGAPLAGPCGRATAAVLNSDYTFERFVIGAANRLAQGAALAVAEAPTEAYNPLFICGPPGLGKTHLLVAIANYLAHHSPDVTVRYTTAECFTNEFVTAIHAAGADAFKDRYRAIDVLLVDDIQFLEGKQHTEEEFFHTFNALYEGGSQIVLSADRLPTELIQLAERLRDRFEWGMLAHLGPPDLPTRLTILRRLLTEGELLISDDALLEIARRSPANVRQLEGALTRIVAFSSLMGEPITPDLVASVLPRNRAVLGVAEPASAENIQVAVAERMQVGRDLLCGPSRRPNVVRARHVAMYLCRELTSLSLPQIGAAFGGRDHSTVVNALRRISAALEADPALRRSVDDLLTDIHSPAPAVVGDRRR
jgi:chromosomal replication initiator protein